MTITQTVNIPDNHRLVIDVPREVPAGPVILSFTPSLDRKSDSTVSGGSRSWRDMQGCCKGQPGSVDEFLADCHSDKERELAIEERSRRA